jgi:hypothetical protein
MRLSQVTSYYITNINSCPKQVPNEKEITCRVIGEIFCRQL